MDSFIKARLLDYKIFKKEKGDDEGMKKGKMRPTKIS